MKQRSALSETFVTLALRSIARLMSLFVSKGLQSIRLYTKLFTSSLSGQGKGIVAR